MHRDLRVVSTGLDTEITVGPLRIELVRGEAGQSLQCCGLPVSEPEPTLALLAKQRRTKAERDGQAGGEQADRLPRVVGWCRVRARSRPEFPSREPLRHSCGGGGPVLEELYQLRAGISDHVKCREVQSILDRSDDASLMFAVEGISTGTGQCRLCRRGLLGSQRETPGSAGGQPRKTGTCGAE